MPGMQAVRHELKYTIPYGEYLHLSRTLDYVMMRDPAGDAYNEYAVRSLYFDTVDDDFLMEKISGVGSRQKYRLRIYNFEDKLIKLERKAKIGDLIAKDTVTVPRDLAEQLMAGDPTGLTRTAEPLLRDVYREMRLRLLRPVVIVDYVREAYLHQAEDVRVTFDKKLHTGLWSTDLFNPFLPTVPAMNPDLVVLEVKFNRVLPDHIRALISSVAARRQAVSKYVLCRQFEEKEY
ncbi:MAG: polyphosphate polymerase domain-containing protein [Oscillospiraceae bacterium]|jgi:hypothetical protein|nr:polyphosphate polymerase domain-containing protein [Oscillospiraceae bacterium]